MTGGIIALIVILVLAVILLAKSVTVIHQAEKGLVERFGRFKDTLDPGLKFIIPFMDTLRYSLQLFPPISHSDI